jgi:hypothetical protein
MPHIGEDALTSAGKKSGAANADVGAQRRPEGWIGLGISVGTIPGAATAIAVGAGGSRLAVTGSAVPVLARMGMRVGDAGTPVATASAE